MHVKFVCIVYIHSWPSMMECMYMKKKGERLQQEETVQWIRDSTIQWRRIQLFPFSFQLHLAAGKR